MIDRLLKKLVRARDPKAETIDAFRAAVRRLTPDDVAIDCGANIGLYTAEMAASGAHVFAFEPNPHAFSELVKRTAGLPAVTPLQKAVADRAGTVQLFLHENAEEDPVKWSTGSSLLSFKGNVREDRFIEVEAVDLVAFIEDLQRPIALVKIDIEGAEVALLRRLLDAGLHKRIGQIFVEVHDRKIPELAGPTNALRRRLREENVDNINLDWQ